VGARAYAFIGYSADYYGEGRLAECLTQFIELLTDLSQAE